MSPARRTSTGTVTGTGNDAFIAPCQPTAAATPPTGPGWVHEIKYDGYRVQAHLAGGTVRLLTRTGLDWTDRFGRVAGEIANLPARAAVIDGEAIVQDARGVSDFHALAREMRAGPDARIVLAAFDLLRLDGRDLRPLPLLERKATLQRLLGTRPPATLLVYGDHMSGDGADVLASACRMGLEGIVSKRTDRPYRSGRSTDWIKVKCIATDDFVVAGYVAQKGTDEAIGSLVLGYWSGGALVYAGRVGTGFWAGEAHAIWLSLQPIRRPASPFAAPLARDQRQGAVWVEPRLVVEVERRGWSPDRVLRHSAFKAFRFELRPADVGPPPSLPPTDDDTA